MNTEQYNWLQFFDTYSTEIETLKTKLEIINHHPETFEALGVDFISADKVDERIKDWLWLLSKLTNPIEIEFSQPTWIPIEKYCYDIFTDLCNTNFPVVASSIRFIDPMFWFNMVLSKSLSQVILNQEFGGEELKFMKDNRRIQLNRILNNPLFNFNEQLDESTKD